MDDRNRMGGRLRRYARVTGAAGAVAARMAGARLLGDGVDAQKNAGRLRAALGDLKGPAMKVAQLLATIPDLLPRAYAAELSQLQAHAPAMGWPFVKRRMAAELGPRWQARFAAFSREAAAAASLGQVHRAKSHDGRDLAVKLQYPDMASAVEADLNQLGALFALFRRIDPTIDTGAIREELAARLREELDYALEARHIALYRHMLADTPGVNLPEVEAGLSTGRVLTMTWLAGRPLLDFRSADQETRNRIAVNLFRAWYAPFHRYGVIHGDPHLGNYAVGDNLSINLMDFGCVRKFTPAFAGGVIDLYRALRDGDRELAVAAYRTWGFQDLSNDMIDTLNIWAAFLYGPLMEDRPRLINAAQDPGAYGRETIGKVRRRLRELGPVRPPREFVLMDRAAVGLGGVFLHLQAQVNWHRLFHEIIDDFDVASLARRQQQAFAAAGLAADGGL